MKVLMIIFLGLVIIMLGCNFEKKRDSSKKDSFYINRGFDKKRIPLVKPYELLKVSANEWRMNLLSDPPIALSVHNVKGINVSNGKILIYSEGGTEVKYSQYDKGWFIVDPLLRKEMFFSSYKLFVDSLRQFAIADTTLFFPDRVYQEFYDSGQVRWNK